MAEIPDNYEDPEALAAQEQLYTPDAVEDPEIDQNIDNLQDWTLGREQNVMNGIHNEDMGGGMEDTYDIGMPEPAMPTDEERYEEEGGAAGGGFAA